MCVFEELGVKDRRQGEEVRGEAGLPRNWYQSSLSLCYAMLCYAILYYTILFGVGVSPGWSSCLSITDQVAHYLDCHLEPSIQLIVRLLRIRVIEHAFDLHCRKTRVPSQSSLQVIIWNVSIQIVRGLGWWFVCMCMICMYLL